MDMASVISLASGNIFSSSSREAQFRFMNSSMYRVVLMRFGLLLLLVVVVGVERGLFFAEEVLVNAGVAMFVFEPNRPDISRSRRLYTCAVCPTI